MKSNSDKASPCFKPFLTGTFQTNVCLIDLCHRHIFILLTTLMRGPGCSVGIAIGYGLDGPGIESRCSRGFPHLSRPALGHNQSPVQWVSGLSRGKERPGRYSDPSPLLVPWSKKSSATPLLPLWAVRPVQSLSACTRVHFTFTFITLMVTPNSVNM